MHPRKACASIHKIKIVDSYKLKQPVEPVEPETFDLFIYGRSACIHVCLHCRYMDLNEILKHIAYIRERPQQSCTGKFWVKKFWVVNDVVRRPSTCEAAMYRLISLFFTNYHSLLPSNFV